MAGRLGWRVWAALGTVYLIWGSTYLGIRYAVTSAPPLLMAGARFVAAGLIMVGITSALRGMRVWRMTRAQAGTAVLSGVLLVLGGNGLVTVGEQRVPSGIAALIVAGVPLWIVLLRAALGDRPARVTVLGVGVGVAGVAALFLPGGGTGRLDVRYALLTVLASLSWAVGSLVAVRRPVPPEPLALSTVQMMAGGVVSLACSAAIGEWRGFHPAQVSGTSWLAIGYLVSFGAVVAYPAYVYLLGTAPVSLVSTYAFVNPVIAVLLGVLVAGERLAGPEILAAAVIVVAVAVVVTAEARARATVRATWHHPDGADPLVAHRPPDRARRPGLR
ncbi:MAG: EamA family transporter [Actinobacteria bacterium]|nr:EamA family transporter [Actinomycetota bacterium]MBI3688044.1 EamA family transporter [Actinomycetota bacterium]